MTLINVTHITEKQHIIKYKLIHLKVSTLNKDTLVKTQTVKAVEKKASKKSKDRSGLKLHSGGEAETGITDAMTARG